MAGIHPAKKDGFHLDMGSFQGLDRFSVIAVIHEPLAHPKP